MSRELTIAFMGFAIASFYTPGPNNIMLLSSGLNYGFRRTVPHIAGITLGFAFLAAFALVCLAVLLLWGRRAAHPATLAT